MSPKTPKAPKRVTKKTAQLIAEFEVLNIELKAAQARYNEICEARSFKLGEIVVNHGKEITLSDGEEIKIGYSNSSRSGYYVALTNR